MVKKLENLTISNFVTQAYVIHRTGMVILSRKYADSCIDSDPQLIGGLITAILTVTKSTTGTEKACDGSEDGKHRLLEFKTTCSTWILNQEDDFVVSLLLPNSSPLLKKPKVIQNITKQILDTYLLYQQFKINTEETVGATDEEQVELGNTIDNFVSDVIKQFFGQKLDFFKEGTIDHYDLSVDSM
ncbi:MAG: hypothetical protein GPJ54_02310 [Candidatus Heimdallarchaeota archaeon]|nr:hypothetical protein [Candidatus Heimdallarchaeota archaeon]